MPRSLFRPCQLCLTLLLALVGAALPAAESLSSRLPVGALGTIEVRNAAVLVDHLATSEALQQMVKSEGYKKWANSPDGRKFQGGVAVVEGQLGRDAWTVVSQVFGHELVFAIYPGENGSPPKGLGVVRFANDDTGTLLKDKLEPWVKIAGDAVKATETDRGWELRAKDGNITCFAGRCVILTNSETLLAAMQERLRSSAEAEPSAATPSPTSTTVSVSVDNARIRELLHRDRLLPAKLDNPLGSLLFGGLLEILAAGPAVDAKLSIDLSGYQLLVQSDAAVKSLDAAHQSFFVPQAEALPLTPRVPRQLAGMTLCRDWKGWYQARDQLIEERVLPEYDKFETGLATFLPGKDFAQDVLGLFQAPVSVVAQEQTFPHLDGRPGLQLPAFAFVIPLKDSQRGSDIFQLFFQTLTTVMNLEAGKQGRQPWVQSSESYRGVQVAFAKYLDTPKGEALPLVFNFQPAASVVKDTFVAASSLELCRDLIDALQAETAASRVSVPQNFELILDPAIAANLLTLNRSVISARAVQSGKSVEQATVELDGLLSLLRHLQPASVTTTVHPDSFELRVEGQWK